MEIFPGGNTYTYLTDSDIMFAFIISSVPFYFEDSFFLLIFCSGPKWKEGKERKNKMFDRGRTSRHEIDCGLHSGSEMTWKLELGLTTYL